MTLRNLGLKYETMAHYSHGAPECAECGWHDLHDLQLDHINNDGKEQRTRMMAEGFGYQMTAGAAFYGYLRSLGYPDDRGLQVLCRKCHVKKGYPSKQRVKIALSIEFDYANPISDALEQLSWEELV